MNPSAELEKFRWSLQSRHPDLDVDGIASDMYSQINYSMLDIVTSAVDDAIAYAESIEAWDFVSDVDLVDDNGIYIIKTKSGLTDYSVDAIQNLPNLLKNANTAEDGSKYKVIPVRAKSPKPSVGTSSADVMQAQSQAISKARADLLNKRGDRRASANLIESFRQQLSSQMKGKEEDYKRTEGKTTGFVTASSKQDAATMWVIPEKKRDMTQYLSDINDKIKSTVEESVNSIIAEYQREYM